MPQRNSNGGNEVKNLRRSPRFLPWEDASAKELQIQKNLVCSPLTLAESKSHSRVPLSSLENTIPRTTIRRSPRFLHLENPSGNAATGNPKSRKNRVCSLSNASAVKFHSESFIIGLASTLSVKKTHEYYPEKISKKKGTRSLCVLPETFTESLNNRSRKSTRPLDVGEGLPSLRRSLRFSNKENSPAFVDNKVCRKGNDSSVKEVTQKGNLGKNRSKNVGIQRVFTKTAGKAEEGINSFYEFGKYREGVNGQSSTVSPAVTPKVWGGKRRSIFGGDQGIRVDRKRKQRDEGSSPQGWTKEQENALQRAFIASKPSPHFWKKVSKLVQGKSAQECFDKVHSNFSTPPHTQRLSRANRTNSSPLGQFSLLESKLLEPTQMSVKRPKNSKQKSRLAQKTVRHLLRKHCLVDQSSEVGLFSLQKDLASPLVLKQVKNISLHEKYIDQLHCREARRTTASSNAAKHFVKGYDGKENHLQEGDVVKIAKNALVSDAQEMISEFKHLQANALSNNDGCDDDYDEDEGDELS